MQKIFTLVLTTIFFLNSIKSIDGRKIHQKDPNWFWKHCTKQHLCMEGEGDCDTDLECHGDLKCGDDNCNGHLHKNADCCFQPARVPTCTYSLISIISTGLISVSELHFPQKQYL